MRYLIIGNCAAGINAVEGIRKVDTKGRITVVSDENCPAYCRCLIPNHLAGTHKEKDLLLRKESFYDDNDLELLLGKKAAGIKLAESKVTLSDGQELLYDRLLIATGASPKSLGVEGEDKHGVFGFRTLNDAKNILELSMKADKALVFGGGLIGLKAGYALKQRGMDVEIIVKSPRVLSQVVDAGAARIASKWLIENGIKIRTGLGPQKVLGNKQVTGVILDNGQRVNCQIVIVGKGVRANMGLVEDNKIATHWGIITNQYLQTNVDNVYAAGDITETVDIATGEPTTNALWTAAAEQGRAAGLNMAGQSRTYPGSIAANSIEFFDLPIISIGYVRIREEGYEEVVRSDPQRYFYKKIVLKGNRLVGVVLVGDVNNAGVYMALIRRKADVSSVKDILLEDYFDYAKASDLLEEKEGFRESVSMGGNVIRMA